VGELVALCRFESGVLVLEERPLETTKYTAVSHIWGDEELTAWRKVKGIAAKVMASEQKVVFLEEELPALVRNEYFWMDILCIDQNDMARKTAIVKLIPTIFRRATKTLVVKDGNGIKRCCTVCLPPGGAIWVQKLIDHIVSNHDNEFLSEGVCERLWLLEEIILSDNLQFVTCKAPSPTKTNELMFDPYKSHSEAKGLIDNIIVLANAWLRHGEDKEIQLNDPGFVNFIGAFIGDGIVSRAAGIPTAHSQSLLSGLSIHNNSIRQS
jgi:hypothetical protein